MVFGLVHHLVLSNEYVLGSIPFSMLRWKGGEEPTYLGVLQTKLFPTHCTMRPHFTWLLFAWFRFSETWKHTPVEHELAWRICGHPYLL